MIGKVRPVDRCGTVVVSQMKDGRFVVLGSKLGRDEDRVYGVYRTEAMARYRKYQVMNSSMPKKVTPEIAASNKHAAKGLREWGKA